MVSIVTQLSYCQHAIDLLWNSQSSGPVRTVEYVRGPDWESVSDLGNGGWPNSMKLGKHIDLDELLQKHPLIGFVKRLFTISKGGHLGAQNHQKKPCLRVNSQVKLK